MKCPNCNEEIDDNARFCESCGKKLNDESTIYCPKCGELTKSNVSFCSNCGHKFTNENTVSNEAYRSAPFILGLIASIYAFIIIIVLLFFSDPSAVFIGEIGIIPFVVGIIGLYYLKKNPQYGGIFMIVSAMLYFFTLLFFSFPAVFLMGLGGLLVLFKN